jgi:hypothetical protein
MSEFSTSSRIPTNSLSETDETRNGKASPYMRRPFTDRVLFWMSSGKKIDGLWIGTETQTERVLPRLEEALGLIKTYDRQRYNRILADLDRIWVRLLTTSVAQFSPPWRACFLDERFVLTDTTDTAHIAMAIVHEATHARLWRYGFGYEEEVRPRVEVVCVRREMAFANKLPDSERVRAWATDALPLLTSVYTDAAFNKRHYEGSLQALRDLGFNWLARALQAFLEWRRARTPGARRTEDDL